MYHESDVKQLPGELVIDGCLIAIVVARLPWIWRSSRDMTYSSDVHDATMYLTSADVSWINSPSMYGSL